MIYVRIAYQITSYGSTADCPILDAFMKRARWQYTDPDDLTTGYAGFIDTDYGVMDSPLVSQVGQSEAIQFKARVERTYVERKISAIATDGMALQSNKMAQIEDVLSGLDDIERAAMESFIALHETEWGLD